MSNTIYNNSNHRTSITNYWRQFYPEYSIPKGYHVHHIIPRSEGGTNSSKNLIALHPDDHASIHRNRGDRWSGAVLVMRNGHSEETKKKLSEMNMGSKHPQYGKTRSAETIRKIIEGRKHYNVTDETKQKQSISARSRCASEDYVNPFVEYNKNNPPWNKGKKMPLTVWVNNGVINKRVKPSDIPEGFVKGRLWRNK